MSEFEKLQRKIKSLSQNNLDAILEELGYKNNKDKAFEKIDVIKENSLRDYLEKSNFDFHYSSKEFLYKLAEKLELNVEKINGRKYD